MSNGSIQITGWSLISASLDSAFGYLAGFHRFEGRDHSVCGQQYDGHPIMGNVPLRPGEPLVCGECVEFVSQSFPQRGDLACSPLNPN